MDPGRAAQTPEAKRRKIKRHAGQMPDTAWPGQGQPKMVGKNINLSIRPGRNKQQKVLLYPPLRNVRLGFITMVSILEF
jgi:hypothetical protein